MILIFCPVSGIFSAGGNGAAFWEKWIAFNWQALTYGSILQITNRLIFTLVSRTDGRSAFSSVPAHAPDLTST
jgi:hypothetical protein